MKNVVGLFGTCDNSQWRVPFIEAFDEIGIEWYNPDAGDNWEPWMAEEENRQLKEDHIILFPVLAESLGLGSLGEIGFSVLNVLEAVQAGADQTLVVLIDDDCTAEGKSEAEIKTSVRTRKLVKSKLKAVTHTNVYLVDTLKDMYDLACQLHDVYAIKDGINEAFRPEVAEAEAATG